MLSPERMSEAEVSLRLAIYFLRHGIAVSDVEVAIDGAQIKTGKDVHFPIAEFLEQHGCIRHDNGSGWAGAYTLDCPHCIIVHSLPGKGDVVTRTKSGFTLRVESKKGSLQRSRSSAEYPLLREALGQLLTLESIGERDILAVAVPNSEKFE